MKRRTFIQTGVASVAAFAIMGTDSHAYAAEKTVSKNTTLKTPQREDPFHLGMAGWTFHKFNLQKTLETMRQLDVRYLCIKDFHLPLDSTDEQIAAFHRKLAEYGVTG